MSSSNRARRILHLPASRHSRQTAQDESNDKGTVERTTVTANTILTMQEVSPRNLGSDIEHGLALRDKLATTAKTRDAPEPGRCPDDQAFASSAGWANILSLDKDNSFSTRPLSQRLCLPSFFTVARLKVVNSILKKPSCSFRGRSVWLAKLPETAHLADPTRQTFLLDPLK